MKIKFLNFICLVTIANFTFITFFIMAQASEEITIVADASEISGSFNPGIAAGVNVRAGAEEELQKFLSQVGADLLRIKVWTWQINENLDNYFVFEDTGYISVLKRYADEIHRRGGKVMMQIYGVPRWLSTCNFATNPNCDKVISNAIPDYSKYPPADYAKWKGLIQGLVRKLQELDIRIDYFEIYGEPNLGSTWWGNGDEKAIPSFLEHYRQTVQAIQSVEPDVKVGGVACGVWDLVPGRRETIWIKAFIDYIKRNNLPLDFFSWHLYTPRTELFRLNARDLRQYLNRQGFNIPLFLTEWGISGGKGLGDKASTHLGASFATASLMEMAQSDNDGQNFYTLTDARKKLSPTKFGLFYADHQPKPSFNAFRLFSMLGRDKIKATTDEKVCAITLKRNKIEQKDIRILATRSSEDISLMATYYVPVRQEKPRYDLSKKVKIVIKNIPFLNYTYKIYLIDKKQSNFYFGSGPELELVESGDGSGDFKKSMDLDIYGTVLVKIEK